MSQGASLKSDLLAAFEKALEYDYLVDRYSNPSDGIAGLVMQHMTAHFLDRYLVTRAVLPHLINDMRFNRKVFLIGANGSGKTAAIIALRRGLRRVSVEQTDEDLIDLIVFNGNANTADLASCSTILEKRLFILTRIGEAIQRRVQIQRQSANFYAPEWLEYITRVEASFTRFNQKFPDWLTSPGLAEYLDNHQQASERWWSIFDDWEDRLTLVNKIGIMIAYLRQRGKRLAIAIDNCDLLNNDDLEAAGQATTDLFGKTKQAPLPVLVAVRPATLERAKASILGIQFDKDRYVNSFERIESQAVAPEDKSDVGYIPTPARVAQDLNDTFRIFDRRLELFRDPSFLTQLGALLGGELGQSRIPGETRALIAEFRGLAVRVLNDYFLFDGRDFEDDDKATPAERLSALRATPSDPSVPATPEQKEDLTKVFTMWHNGSVRELGVSLLRCLIRLEPGFFGPETYRNVLDTADSGLTVVTASGGSAGPTRRTQLFRHVFFYKTTGEDLDQEDFPEIHPAFRLFSLTATHNHSRFNFPRARVLQYLHSRRGESHIQTVEAVRSALSNFGVAVDLVDQAILELAERRGYLSGLIRVDGIPMQNGHIVLDRLSGDRQLEILPAGAILISRLVYVVEFQFWSAIGEEASRVVVADGLGVDERRLVGKEFLTSNNRLRVALAYLALVLIPRFERDHPYLSPDFGNVVSPEDVDRLRLFAEQFGFGVHKWHLSRAAKQIERYLQTRDDLDATAAQLAAIDPQIELFYRDLKLRASRLDSILEGKFTSP